MNKKAFTFVELIVVVSIIIILGFIGTIGYKSYLGGINDSAKITQLSMIHKALQQTSALGKLPKPDNYMQVTQSGRVMLYQGDITQNLLKKLDIPVGKIVTDNPQDFFYAHTNNKKYFQVGTFVKPDDFDESQFQIQTVQANENKQPYFLGKNIGVFFDDQNIPLHQKQEYKDNLIDLSDLDTNITLRLSQRDFVTGTGTTFDKYQDLITQGGKGCSTDGITINCMVYDDERELGSGFGYTEETGGLPGGGGGGSTTPGAGHISIPPVSYPSDLAQMFRPSTSSDYNVYTDTWNENLASCNPADMSIVEYYPGDTIDTYISSGQSNTIFVFNEGNYTIPEVIDTSSSATCLGFIGKGNVQIGLSDTQTNRWTTIQSRSQRVIIAGLTFDGASDGINALTSSVTQRGIYLRDVTEFAISNVTTFNHGSDGVRIYGTRGLLQNIETYNNGEEGLQIGRDGSSEVAINVNVKNIISYNNQNNGIAIIRGNGIAVNQVEVYNNQIAGISMETVSKGYISNVWTYNNQNHGIQIGNNLNVDSVFVDNIKSYSNLASGIYIDDTVDSVHINNSNLFDNTNGGVWSAGTNIAVNNSNIFNNNNYGISIATQGEYTLLRNISVYKNQQGPLLNNGMYSTKSADIFTDSTCTYCTTVNISDIENGNYIQVNGTPWNYTTSGRNNITQHQDTTISFGSAVNTQRQPFKFKFNSSTQYGTDGVEYFTSTDPMGKQQDTITELIFY